MKAMVISAVLLAIALTNDQDILMGRWESNPSPSGNVFGIIFRADSTYVGYSNKKHFVSGQYKIKDSLMTIIENGCDDKPGIYKIILFNNNDSLRFSSINDGCNERREGMNRIVLGRVNRPMTLD